MNVGTGINRIRGQIKEIEVCSLIKDQNAQIQNQ